MAVNVSDVHEAPEPGNARRRGFRALQERYPFKTRAASARQRALREMFLLDAVGLAGGHATVLAFAPSSGLMALTVSDV